MDKNLVMKLKTHPTRRTILSTLMILGIIVSAGIGQIQAQSSIQLFPQLVLAQNDLKPPPQGTRLNGPTADKVKAMAKKDHVFEINHLARKPVTLQERKTERVLLSSEVTLELELVNANQVSVRIVDAKTRKILKSQPINIRTPQNILIGSDGEPRVVIILTVGDKRPR